MKLLQKTYPLVGILLLCGGILLGAEKRRSSQGVLTKKKVLKSIKKVSEKVFPSDENLLDKKNNKTQKWYKMLSKVRSYVNENADGNEDLIDAFTVCWNAGRELINVLKNTYNSLFAEGRIMSYDNVETAHQNIRELGFEHEINLQGMKRKLKSISYSGKREDVRDVLISLATHIGSTISRLRNEFSNNREIGDVIYDESFKKRIS